MKQRIQQRNGFSGAQLRWRACPPLLCLWLLLLSCDIDGDLEECPYNARLVYWYTGNGQANVLPDYIYTMHEFVFDSLGVLQQVNQRTGQRDVASELNVPPGNYTLIAWANLDSASHINRAEVGRTTQEEMELYLQAPYQSSKSAGGYQQNTERLYYGFATFRTQTYGVTRQRIDMMHSHCVLNITVKWKRNPPRDTHNFSFYLCNLPDRYRFMPGYEVRGSTSRPYGAAGYATGDATTRATHAGYIPLRSDGSRWVDHRVDVSMDITRTLSGEFVTYRLRNDDHPVLRICAADALLVKEIDLYRYFRQMDIDLDENIRQEFNLIVEVDGDKVLVGSATVSDWIDGGVIGGVM